MTKEPRNPNAIFVSEILDDINLCIDDYLRLR
jgi:hypothetical protein